MPRRAPKLSARAAALLERIKAGDFYPAYSKRTPKAMQELVDAGLVMGGARVAHIVSCYVPRKGFKPLRCERWSA